MLDGSGIREAREKQGLSQAGLAEKVGASQQTIDKIERGVMKRTTYLPEICKALQIDAALTMSPVVVLRTILCANPTAEQILAALAANGLAIVSVNARNATTDEIVDDPLIIVREILERRQISANKLAEKAGLAASTLNRALNNPGHKFMLSTRTLKKIKEWDQAQ